MFSRGRSDQIGLSWRQGTFARAATPGPLLPVLRRVRRGVARGWYGRIPVHVQLQDPGQGYMDLPTSPTVRGTPVQQVVTGRQSELELHEP